MGSFYRRFARQFPVSYFCGGFLSSTNPKERTEEEKGTPSPQKSPFPFSDGKMKQWDSLPRNIYVYLT